MSGLEKLVDRGGNVCEKCERPFSGLKADVCPRCRGGELVFIALGLGLYAADSPKLGEDRRYVVMKVEHSWRVNVGISPVYRGGKPLPFENLHEAKCWCRQYERDLEVEE